LANLIIIQDWQPIVEETMQNTFKTAMHICHTLAFSLALLFPMSQSLAGDESSAGQIADQFDQAIKSGDTEAIRNILHDDVLIYEGGSVEASFEEYASHHMEADIAFMSGMEKTVLSRKVFEQDEMAVVSTRYQMRGNYKGRFIDKASMETLVMKKSGSHWKIVHIHWS